MTEIFVLGVKPKFVLPPKSRAIILLSKARTNGKCWAITAANARAVGPVAVTGAATAACCCPTIAKTARRMNRHLCSLQLLERFPIRSTRKLQGSWPESALDFMFVAFPIGKPVSTFPGNALTIVMHKVRAPRSADNDWGKGDLTGHASSVSDGTRLVSTAQASLAHFRMKLFLAAPESLLPCALTAFGKQASRLHFLMKLLSAAPASGLPCLPTALLAHVACAIAGPIAKAAKVVTHLMGCETSSRSRGRFVESAARPLMAWAEWRIWQPRS